MQTNAKDYELVFLTVNTLLHRYGGPPLPAFDAPSYLANTFQDLFLKNVTLIHQGIRTILGRVTKGTRWVTRRLLSYFLSTGNSWRYSEIGGQDPNQIMRALDSLPTWLIKQCIIPCVTRIINMSLDSGVVTIKNALVRPLLKKPRLDADCRTDYISTVSKLSFISKQTPWVVIADILNENM